MKDVRMNPEKNNKNVYSWHKQIFTEYTTVGCNNKHIYIIQEIGIRCRGKKNLMKNISSKKFCNKILLKLFLHN